MERDGLLHVAGDATWNSLTKAALAVAVMRKHRLAERLLVDVIGCRGKKYMRSVPVGTRDERRRGTAAVKVLNTDYSPFEPDPGLLDLGVGPDSGAEDGNLVRLTELPRITGRVVVRQLTSTCRVTST